jgi:hypothetical protein
VVSAEGLDEPGDAPSGGSFDQPVGLTPSGGHAVRRPGLAASWLIDPQLGDLDPLPRQLEQSRPVRFALEADCR